ncbi:MAG: hypothetical protein ACFE9L_12665 [Candidatus Hodarchaeota archaeon]
MAKEEESGKAAKSRKIFDRIKESGKEFVDGVKEELEAGTAKSKERTRGFATRKSDELRTTIKERVTETSTPEDIYFSTWAWFWTMIFAVFICLTIFLFGLTSTNFLLVGLLALIAIPFIVIWCLIHMVPTIKIFGFTIFDRRRLSLRRQLSVGKEIARLFSREFLQESPLFAFLILLFCIMFVFAILLAILPT